MNIQDFIEMLRTVFEDGGELKLDENMEFRSIESWDSLAVLGFISMVDAEFNVQVGTAELKEAKTILDLYDMVKSRMDK